MYLHVVDHYKLVYRCFGIREKMSRTANALKSWNLMVQIPGLSNFSLVLFCIFDPQSRSLKEVQYDFRDLCINSSLSITSLL